MDKRALAGLGIVAAALLVTRKSSASSSSAPVGPMPKSVANVPFAAGDPRPAWPVLTSSKSKYVVSYVDVDGKTHGNSQRDFGEQRDDPDGDRRHVGVDVYGNAGDPVVATEDGVVARLRPTFNLGTGILFLQSPRGITIAYGEIAPNSWKDFGITEGMRVRKGQKIARVGCMRHEGNVCTSQMIHFEIYKGQVTKNEKWSYSGSPPSSVLNPTLYLLRARAAAGVVA